MCLTVNGASVRSRPLILAINFLADTELDVPLLRDLRRIYDVPEFTRKKVWLVLFSYVETHAAASDTGF